MVKIVRSPILDNDIPINIRDDYSFFKEFLEGINNSDINKSCFYENVSDVELHFMNKKNNIYKGYEVKGLYSKVTNELFVTKDYSLEIFHELFHLASTKVYKDVIYSGFSQMTKNDYIGFGLNEAYTSILDMRYFPSKEKDVFYENTYSVSRVLVMLLEQLIGQEKMEKYYSECNLLGLINDLKVYFGEYQAIKLINLIDAIEYYNLMELNINPIVVLKCFRSSLTYIGRCMIMKNVLEYKNNSKTTDMYIDELKNIENIMNKRLIFPIPFKILKSRKYSRHQFLSDVKKIEMTYKKYT